MSETDREKALGLVEAFNQASPEEKIELLRSMMKKRHLMRMLVAIIDVEQEEKIDAIFAQSRVRLIFKVHGEGTANSEMLDLLGIGSSSKTIAICITPSTMAQDLMARITKDFRMRVRGNGIVFLLPMSGAAMPALKILSDEIISEIEKQVESEVNTMKNESLYELILAVVDRGYSEEVMDAAKSAGATGGTVIHARQALAETAKVWGITLQGEREVIAILVPKDQKIAIMKAINVSCGINSSAHGITISLPVSDVAGLED